MTAGRATCTRPSVVTHLAGLRAALPAAEVLHAGGSDLDEAAALATSADVAIVVVGYTRADEGEYIGQSGSSHLAALMPSADEAGGGGQPSRPASSMTTCPHPTPSPAPTRWASPPAAIASGSRSTSPTRRSSRRWPPPTRERSWSWSPAAPSSPSPGGRRCRRSCRSGTPAWKAGHAFADVVLGAADATGRLPFSVPTDAAHLPPFDREADAVTYDGWHGYWKLARDRHQPAFPFGFGLSYTTWEIGPTDRR